MRTIIFLAVATSLAGFQAQAYCSEPSFSERTPSAPYSKPDKPYCLSSFDVTGEHSCSDWEIRSYLEEIERYIRDLNTYHSEAVNFANEAIRYSNEALEYAKCEADEVSD